MTDMGTAVVLLFDDTEMVGQLREALHERGARIVHEGGVASLSRELLQRVGAEVVVVNLDDAADDALDQLYEVIDGDRPRVVFNDAQASRALTGWDRARWARHLAVKALASGDVDPPRPVDARGIDVPVVESIEPAGTGVVEALPEQVPATAMSAAELMEAASTAEPLALDLSLHDEEQAQLASTESENLAAELEALLASGQLPLDEAEESGSALRHADGDKLPPLHDGNFGELSAAFDAPPTARVSSADIDGGDTDAEPAVIEHPGFQLDHLQLASMDNTDALAVLDHIPVDAIAKSASAPQGWALLDDEVTDYMIPENPDATAFKVEKLSAADFLAPDVEQVAHGVEPIMSLELESMEEAIAPQAYVNDSEMLLDDLGGVLSRIVLLGVAVDGMESVCMFLAALPATTRLTFLHTQHLGAQPDTALVKQLAAHCTLPVRLAKQGTRAVAGEVLVVPAGQPVRLRRDGLVEFQSDDVDAMQDPSIDASFSMAAGAFGRDAVAIVFAGRGNDAVAGAQAVHDRGGQVWVESSSGEHSADMVSGIFAERLVSFSGTPHELAAHLIEVFP